MSLIPTNYSKLEPDGTYVSLVSGAFILQQDHSMGPPLPQAQSSLVNSLVTIIHHPVLQNLFSLGSSLLGIFLLDNVLLLGFWNWEGWVNGFSTSFSCVVRISQSAQECTQSCLFFVGYCVSQTKKNLLLFVNIV